MFLSVNYVDCSIDLETAVSLDLERMEDEMNRFKNAVENFQKESIGQSINTLELDEDVQKLLGRK